MVPNHPGPGQIFRGPTGEAAIYVRTEQRTGSKQPEHLFVFAKDRVVFNRWVTELPEDYEVVNDTAGRMEASLAWAETQALQYERDALSKCLKAAVAMLDDRAAEELRGIYSATMAKADLVSV